MKTLNTGGFEFPVAGEWEIPVIERQKLEVKEIIGFNYVISNNEHDKVVHFFLDDHEFVRVWNFPNRYVEVLAGNKGCFSPQFSLWRDLSLAVQVYNTYRNRYIGKFWQTQGISVIPSLAWSDERSYEFCFLGVEKGSHVAITTRGIARDVVGMNLWKQGYDEMMNTIEPKKIYIYGSQKRINKKYKLEGDIVWLQDGHLHF